MALKNFLKSETFVRKVYRASRRDCSHPFEWDKKLQQPLLTRNPRVLVQYYLNAALALTYYSFVCFRVVQQMSSDEVPQIERLQVIFICVGFLTAVMCQFGMLSRKEEMANSVQQYMFLLRRC